MLTKSPGGWEFSLCFPDGRMDGETGSEAEAPASSDQSSGPGRPRSQPPAAAAPGVRAMTSPGWRNAEGQAGPEQAPGLSW